MLLEFLAQCLANFGFFCILYFCAVASCVLSVLFVSLLLNFASLLLLVGSCSACLIDYRGLSLSAGGDVKTIATKNQLPDVIEVLLRLPSSIILPKTSYMMLD